MESKKKKKSSNRELWKYGEGAINCLWESERTSWRWAFEVLLKISRRTGRVKSGRSEEGRNQFFWRAMSATPVNLSLMLFLKGEHLAKANSRPTLCHFGPGWIFQSPPPHSPSIPAWLSSRGPEKLCSSPGRRHAVSSARWQQASWEQQRDGSVP